MAHFKFKVFLNLIRALFPKWNFFDRIAYTFELHFKLKPSASWQQIKFDQYHTNAGLFINEKCNLSLAEFNIVEHFANDVQEHLSSITTLTSYKLLTSLLESKLSTTDFQFKILAVSPAEKIDIYVSDRR